MINTVLVTGGAGFIGSHTVLDLASHKYRPVIIDSFANANRDVIKKLEKVIGKPLVVYKGDLQDKAFISKVFDSEDVSGIIHFAALKSIPESIEQPLRYYSNNVGGLLNLLSVATDAGSPPLVFSSSCTVYGGNHFKPIKESVSFRPPLSPYAATKQICERILAEHTGESSFKARSLRYFNVIGASPDLAIGENLKDQTPNVLKSAMHSAVSGEPFSIYGNDHPTPDGSPARDFVHVSDVAKAHVAALRQLMEPEGKEWDVYNVGAEKAVTILEIMEIFEEVSNMKLKYNFINNPPGYAAMAVADSSKIKKDLGWQPQKSLRQAVTDSWEWYKMVEVIK